MRIDNKILEEIKRYKSINKYIMEQGELPPPPPGGDAPIEEPLGGGAPPAPEAGAPPAPEAGAPPAPTGTTEIDVEKDADVEAM